MSIPRRRTFECPTHGVDPGTIVDQAFLQRTGRLGKPTCEQCGQICLPVEVISTAMSLYRDVQDAMAMRWSTEPAKPLSTDPEAIAQAVELTQLRSAVDTLQTAIRSQTGNMTR